MYKLLTYHAIKDGYPNQPKALHFINFPQIMETIFKMVQTFQKEKMRKRNHISVKGDYSKLHEDLGTEVLPPEYGGSGPSVEELTSEKQNFFSLCIHELELSI